MFGTLLAVLLLSSVAETQTSGGRPIAYSADVGGDKYVSAFDNCIPHIAFGQTWTTRIVLMNLRNSTVTVPIYFTGDSGKATSIPIGGKWYSSVNATLPPLGKAVFETDYLPDVAGGAAIGRLNIPCESVELCGNVGGFAMFSWHLDQKPVQEAIVPFTSSLAHRAVVSFDERQGYFTGVGLAHPLFIDTAAADITVIARDAMGNELVRDHVRLNAGGHTAFLLKDRWPELEAQQGTLEFSSDDYVSALGLVFSPTGAFTTSPAFLLE